MPIAPYLFFDGSCREAMETYATVLGATVEMMQTYKDAPPGEAPNEADDRIMHASLRLPDGAHIYASDSPPQYFEAPQGYAVSIGLTDPDDARRIFDALAEGGEVRMPLDKTFWARAFGMVKDRFGTPWMINCE